MRAKIHIEGCHEITGPITVKKHDDVLVLTLSKFPDTHVEMEIPWEEWLVIYEKVLVG